MEEIRVQAMIKRKLLTAIIFTALLIIGACATTARPSGELPNSLFSKNPTEWAELKVYGVSVDSINGHTLNWGSGSVTAIPAGKHRVVVRPHIYGASRKNIVDTSYAARGDTATFEFEFLPGRAYIVEPIGTDRRESGDNIIITHNIGIREYGVSQFPSPGRNESLVEFTITGTSPTFISVNGHFYSLSPLKDDNLSRLLLVLPPGSHYVYSPQYGGRANLNLQPGRFVSFNINTIRATITQIGDQPLDYLGKWRFAPGDGRAYMDITFSLNGRGFSAMYENNIFIAEESGLFYYSVSGSNITMRDASGNTIMGYRVSQDTNSITLDNFYGHGLTLTGVKL